jgi:hypothetical protein
MEVRVSEIDDAVASLVLDVRVCDVPLFWNGPVEHLCSTWNLANLKVQLSSDQPQCLSDSVAGDARADRLETADSLEQFSAFHICRRLRKPRQRLIACRHNPSLGRSHFMPKGVIPNSSTLVDVDRSSEPHEPPIHRRSREILVVFSG